MDNSTQKKFLNLYKPVHGKFERFCRARVYGKMDFKDLMNETYLIAYQKIDSVKSDKVFLSFLIGISIRILANHNAKKKEELISHETELILRDENALTERNAEVYMLYQALALLSEEQRECIVLFEITGFSIKEIVKIQNASESAIKQRLKRGREKLKEILSFESQYKMGEVNNG